MKRVFAIALVLCLVFGAVFADKGKLEVGARAGYAEEFFQLEYAKDLYSMKFAAVQPAFNVTASASYGLSDSLAFKAAIGANFNGKVKSQLTVNSVSGDPDTASEATPANFNFYLGAEYGLSLSRSFELVGGLGADIMMGKQSCADGETSNTRIGFGVEVIGKYIINKNIKINLGGKFAVHFFNTGDKTTASVVRTIDTYTKLVDLSGGKVSHFQGAFAVFAGVTYVL